MKTNTIRLNYEEVSLLTQLLQKEITELGVDSDPRFSEYHSALQKLSEEKRRWYSQKSYFSTYESAVNEGSECD